LGQYNVEKGFIKTQIVKKIKNYIFKGVEKIKSQPGEMFADIIALNYDS